MEFHDRKLLMSDIVAFLDGFAWLYGFANEVVIYRITPDARTSEKVLAGLKKQVEEILATRQVPNGRITKNQCMGERLADACS